MTPPDRRFFSLDVLRGLAVVMVLAAHVPLPDAFAHGPGGRAFRLGVYCVVLFFVLSAQAPFDQVNDCGCFEMAHSSSPHSRRSR